ncbi:putative transporter (major facilitator superfamily) [Fusarium austroafricanum]|uniref:Putative transporter (Major facilitator superfamily) n=1 Tax=Fusarium austroafricanum TaxID=2364996 RepID=A0A8H4KM43_9HYPO|nr:putative transporter (major facilitator superfamily) [Fusarium austroafricanum]
MTTRLETATSAKADVNAAESVQHHELADTVIDAQVATGKEQTMSLLKGIKLYPKAIGWSVLLSTAIIMEGYDGVLMGSFYAVDSFNRKYGTLQPDGSYSLSAAWQAGLSNSMSVGQIFGLFICGLVSERLGYRKTMLSALFAVTCFIFILFFAPSLEVLCAGEVLMGISLGVFQTITVTYASEVCPVVLRCYLTTYVNLCWVIGQLIASGVLRGFVTREDEWAYRIPFAIQWVWPIPIMVGVFLAPESPWWLVRQGREKDAVASLQRLTSRGDTDFNPDETVAMMIHTNELEKEIEQGTTFLDCFRGVDLRRTEIVCLAWGAQNLCGSGIMGYSTYFYTQAGLSTENAFNMSLGQAGLGFFGTLFSWYLMTHYGRRSLYVGGLATLFIILMAVGFSSLADNSKSATSWATGSLLLVYTFFYDLTVGPVCYSLVSELSSTRLRAKTIVLARNLYNILSIVNGVIIPYMLNPTAWNWRGKAGFFWAGLCGLCVIWSFFRLPEPKGRTYGELDKLFQQGVSPRKFKETTVDPFENEISLKEKEELNE